MRTKPSIAYNGITIIIDEPSRFDKDNQRLLSGPAGDFLNTECFPSGYSIDGCDIWTADAEIQLIENTRGIILSGELSCQKFGRVSCDPPGYITIALNKPALPIFYVQDACDFRNMRGGVSDDDKNDAITDRESKERIPTRRKNYRHWISWHVKKFLSANVPSVLPINIRAYPRLDEARAALDACSNGDIYLDIETSRVHRCLSCIGFSTSLSFPTVYVVPVYLSTGDLAYRDFHKFHRSLSLALARNQVVIHNSMFDLLVLHGFYKFCLPSSVYDTMCAQHRISPEAEKSLAHVISAWTNQPNHKDFNTEVYNQAQERNLWTYNAHDVYNLKLIKYAQLSYAAHDSGLMASIQQVNASIIPYLSASLTGLRLDQLRLSAVQLQLLKKKRLFERMASILVGKPFNPGSSKQCADFLHNTLNYAIETRTKKGDAAIGSKQLYQMQLKYNNPLIPVILKYREAAKDASSLESELFLMP